MIVSFLFSAAIYQIQMNEIQRLEASQRVRINRQLQMHNMPPIVLELGFTDEVQQHLLFNLFYLNAAILGVSAVAAWILSGKTLRPIHSMMTEQRRFISDASHELKTPLTSLKTAFEVFMRSKKKNITDANTIIKESIVEVDRLHELTDSLLQLAHVQQPLTSHVFEQVSIKKLLESAIKKIKPLAQKKLITIELTGADVSAEIITEEITKLCVILLENAIKYSPKKSLVNIETQQNRTEAIIKISDSGVGISQKDMPHIFDRFYRADDARTRTNTSGYGLGLSIAKQIINKHRGTIQVESTVKKGTTFIVRIPKKRILF
jgi:signal transduction histidine kinase